MKLVFLIFLLIYYFCISALALGTLEGENPINAFNISGDINASEVAGNEQDTGGLFGSGVSFGRFFMFVAFGVGAFPDAPQIISTLFIGIQSCLTVLSIGFAISSIWNG